LLLFLAIGGACIDGILLSNGVRGFFGGLECIDPELLNDVTELLKPPFKKLESILTGEGGLKDLDLSPSNCTCADFRIFV